MSRYVFFFEFSTRMGDKLLVTAISSCYCNLRESFLKLSVAQIKLNDIRILLNLGQILFFSLVYHANVKVFIYVVLK